MISDDPAVAVQAAAAGGRRVAALAGRLIDRPGGVRSRFPPPAVPQVRARLAALFGHLNLTDLACSAAAGADLLALEAAAARGVRRHVVLPGDPAEFVDHSVASRPGPWLGLFERLVLTPGPDLTLETLGLPVKAYAEVNEAILGRALALASMGEKQPLVILVWDGDRGPDDITADFGERAKARGFERVDVSTRA